MDNNLDADSMAHKCNQCDFASSRANALKIHLKKHSVEKSEKCSQCNYASIYKNALKMHLKSTVEKNPKNAINVTMHQFIKAL